ncbi:hypothetical protein BOTBODRAFT_170106 [Botryobasidium botryosum FD-172 SS1]|uniref:Integrase core domain-containing protein n=1 Tax=Botryobasidium botryosum (strain FD-172 SS1) TaxID=930990 RepID=A0A067MWU1_BOTB1|nr:hypothetical protein BOTBODRAFT_170106 [Botryobasidium botryosum FD-172 SS1]
MRGDRGGENTEVAVRMVLLRGPNRRSFIWGTSTRNVRIERLWVEVGSQFVRTWRAFFQRLERDHGLDPSNQAHLWLLHSLFLDLINEDCDAFKAEWNLHGISGPTTGMMSPADLRFAGQTQHGIYSDEPRTQVEDIAQVTTDAFAECLQTVVEQGVVPEGMGVRPEEWGPDGYPVVEAIQVGRRRGAEETIDLPMEVWYPRAALWCQSLCTLQNFLELQAANEAQ